jgi:hypothetical protein
MARALLGFDPSFVMSGDRRGSWVRPCNHSRGSLRRLRSHLAEPLTAPARHRASRQRVDGISWEKYDTGIRSSDCRPTALP